MKKKNKQWALSSLVFVCMLLGGIFQPVFGMNYSAMPLGPVFESDNAFSHENSLQSTVPKTNFSETYCPFSSDENPPILRLDGIDPDEDWLGAEAPLGNDWAILLCLSLFYFIYLTKKRIMKQLFRLKKMVFLFCLILGFAFTANAQNVYFDIKDNPQVVRMGGTSDFKLDLVNGNTTPVNGLTLEATLPTGFVCKTATLGGIPGTIAGNKVTFTIATLAGSSTLNSILSIEANCSAAQVGSTISYDLKQSGTSYITPKSTTGVTVTDPSLILAANSSIASPYTSDTETYTRVFSITQTAPGAYVNNVQVVNTCTPAVLEITKLELVTDMTGNTLVSGGDITAQKTNNATNYTYLLNGAVFTKAGRGTSLDQNEVIYIKETYKVKTCGDGKSTYTFGYGDGTTFCMQTSNPTIVDASVIQPGYSVDITNIIALVPPTSSTNDGRLAFKLSNNSPNPEAHLYNAMVKVLNNTSQIFYTRAYFVDASGNEIAGAPVVRLDNTTAYPGFGAANPTVWMAVFDQLSDPSKAAIYESYGLADADGDGVWDDIVPGKTVRIGVAWNFDATKALSSLDLESSATRYAYLCYYNTCGAAQSFIHPYTPTSNMGNGSTTQQYVGVLRYDKPRGIRIESENVSINSEANLIIDEQSRPGSDNVGWTTWVGNYDQYLVITLPEGFDYDVTQPGATISNTSVAINKVVKSTVGGRIVLTIKNEISVNSSNQQYVIKMKAIPGMTQNSKKDIGICHQWGFKGETLHDYACFPELPVYYRLIEPCQGMTLESFDAQRTIFGWTDPTMTQRITLNNIATLDPTNKINRDVAGPYDNVDMKGVVTIHSGFALGGTDKLLVDVSYDGAAANEYFILPDNNEVAVLSFNGTDISIPVSKLSRPTPVTTATGKRYTLRLDLTDYTKAGQLLAGLQANDQFQVVLKAQTREELPITLTYIENFNMQLYIDINGTGIVPANCNLLAKNFGVVDYKNLSIGLNPTGGVVYENSTNAEYNSTYVYRGLPGYSNQEIFTGEYRPNQIATQYVSTFNTLINITGVKTVGYVLDVANTTNLVSGTDYTVQLSNGKTILTVTKPLSGEVFGGGHLLWEFTGTYYCIKDLGQSVSIDYQLYPSSARNDVNKTVNASTTNKYSSVFHYKYNLSTVQSDCSPVSKTASWNLRVTNQSPWTGTDTNLPHSWIAVEVPAGVDPASLKLSDGVNTWTRTDATNYSGNKYWWKLDELTGAVTDIPTFKEYTLSCEYTDCSQMTLKATYGMGKAMYPINPDQGYPNGNGSSCGDYKSVNLTLSPKAFELAGTVISPAPDGVVDNTKYSFCTPKTFKATFASVQESVLENPTLKVLLSTGYTLLPTSVTAKQGTTTIPNASITITYETDGSGNQVAVFTMPAGTALQPYGDLNGKDKLEVTFQLTPACGFVNGSPVYMTFSAKSPCQVAPLSKTYNSNGIYIDGVEDPTLYSISLSDFTVSSPLDLSNATAASAAKISVAAKITLSSAASSDFDYLFLTIPANTSIQNVVSTPAVGAFTQIGTTNQWKAKLPNNLTQNELINLSLELKPKNFDKWSCNNDSVKVQTGKLQELTCGGSTCEVINMNSNEQKREVVVNKVDLSLSGLTLNGKFASATTETITVNGTLTRPAAYKANAMDVKVALYLDNDNSGTFTPGDVIAAGTSLKTVAFAAGSETFDISNMTFTVNASEVCKLMFVVLRTDNPYICSNLLAKPAIGYSLNTVGSICQNDATGVTVGTTAMTGYTYSWETPTAGSLSASNVANPTYTTATVPTGNKVTLKLNITRAGGCTATAETEVSVTPVQSTWIALGSDADWNTPENWSNGIPGACTDVTIAAGKTKYPTLDAADAATCNSIYFEHGGEVARTDFLSYKNNAKVDLTISRDRWYMVAPSLRDMYAGDYWLAPNGTVSGIDYNRHNPRVYMQVYQACNPQKSHLLAQASKWSTPFNTLEVPLVAGMGYVVGIDGGSGTKTFTFPRTETKYEYFDKVAPHAPNARWTGTLSRASASKLIFDATAAGTIALSDNTGFSTVLVGNPFMAHLNFDALRAANANKLEAAYYIWNGQNSFETELQGYTTNPGSGSTGLIAPMQSFIVKKHTSVGSVNLTSLQINGSMSVVNGGNKLKNGFLNDFVNIEIQREGERQSAITLVYEPGVKNSFDERKDVTTMFSEEVTDPAILYSLSDNIAASIRTLGDLDKPIALGIRSAKKGVLSIKLNEASTLPYPVYLEDRLTGRQVELSKADYSFDNATGDIEGRLFLRIGTSYTAINDIAMDGIKIQAENGIVSVISTADNLIRNFEIIGLQGQVLVKKQGLSVSQLSHSLPGNQQIVIVKVDTERQVKTQKIVVK